MNHESETLDPNRKGRSAASTTLERVGAFISLLIVVGASGCRTADGPLRFTGSTIEHVNELPPSGQPLTLNVYWSGEQMLSFADEGVGSHIGRYSTSWLKQSFEPGLQIAAEGGGFVTPFVWGSAVISGTVYGAFGHLIMSCLLYTSDAADE